MRLKKVRVTNYRSVLDSGEFEVNANKTILVGPNEAGKSAILQAIQQLNPPEDVKRLNALRDYPRAHYNKISQGELRTNQIAIVVAEFVLDDEDRSTLPEEFQNAVYKCWRNIDNSYDHMLCNVPAQKNYGEIESDLVRLAAHADKQFTAGGEEGNETESTPTETLNSATEEWSPRDRIRGNKTKALLDWLKKVIPYVDEDNEREQTRYKQLETDVRTGNEFDAALGILKDRLPIFVLFTNYFRVRPLIHLHQLATRIQNNTLDEALYDYGNVCLLRLLGFDAAELSAMGETDDPDDDDPEALEKYREELDERQYQLNAAEVHLTREIRSVWKPDETRGEDAKLRLRADGQYLKVTVEDDLGVEVELDQRSEGFQWLVSFFTVFFAESQGKHKNAVLLLDEPGLSLHGLKQRDFRDTISRLSEDNQTLYTTHSPFLVGPDELDRVRVVEMPNREMGTKVRTSITAKDPAALLPLQEALGYDLAQSLFVQERNLILEGLTDYWYIEGIASMLRDSGAATLNERIALVPAHAAGKVVYFATILHAQRLKVAALLDSDSAGDQAAKQDTLVS